MQTAYVQSNQGLGWMNRSGGNPNAISAERHRTVGESIRYAGSQYGSVEMGGRDILIQGDNATINLANVAVQDEKQQLKLLMESLAFERMDARLHNVVAAMPRTGQWIFGHPQFQTWLHGDAVNDHNGFLWIKGKPGSGKSTLMKEILFHQECACTDEIILHYFFNARSPDMLERSSIGLYRFILHQLISSAESTQEAFRARFKSKITAGKVRDWTEVEMCNFLAEIIQRNLVEVPIVLLIDALDEGFEEDVRRMVAFLENLASRAIWQHFSLRIIFSSRHYPHISINRGLYITLEDQAAHSHDIQLYIEQHLPITWGAQFDNLRQRILIKSAGVFLWVVLVIPLLRQVYDRGGGLEEMGQKLDTIPQRLNDLFTEILNYDPHGLEVTFRLFRWVLYSFEPLQPRELYAICHPWSSCQRTYAHAATEEELSRFILHCSRGLVEIGRALTPVVQFIHETIRDFLQAGAALGSCENGLNTRGIGVGSCKPSMGHTLIAMDCLNYLWHLQETPSMYQNRPLLLWYAVAYWCAHAKHSNEYDSPQVWPIAFRLLSQPCISGVDYLVRMPPTLWSIAERPDWVQPGWARRDRNVLHRATRTDLSPFVRWLLRVGAVNNAQSTHRWLSSALAAASGHGQSLMVKDLLIAGADPNVLEGRTSHTALYKASAHGHQDIVRVLLSYNAEVDVECGPQRISTALHAACIHGHHAIFCILLDSGAKIEIETEGFIAAVVEVASCGYHDIMAHLLTIIGSINVHDDWYEESLAAATEYGEEAMVKSLLLAGRRSYEEKGAASIHIDVLYAAFEWNSKTLIDLMLDWMPENDRNMLLHEVLEDALENHDWVIMTIMSLIYGTKPLSTWPKFEFVSGNRWRVCVNDGDVCFDFDNNAATFVDAETPESPAVTNSSRSIDESSDEGRVEDEDSEHECSQASEGLT